MSLSNILMLNKAAALALSEGTCLLLSTAAFSVVTAVLDSVLNEGLWPDCEDSSQSEETTMLPVPAKYEP